MTARVEVAAAVILRADGREFLLAQRPPGKVYAGYWEFPGGKVEAGESVRAALIRELDEELGIKVSACSPWLTREFIYPHAAVRIHFWRVLAWQGEIDAQQPVEHSALAWQRVNQAVSVSPLLPANAPILKALALPNEMAISMGEIEGTERSLERLEEALAGGLRLLQIRDKGWPRAQRLWFAESMGALARQAGALVLVNDDADIARRVGADGLHLSAARLQEARQRPDFAWVGASVHDAEQLAAAARLGLDYALLGPVLPTPSHPEQVGLGWETFARLIAETPLPVLALGGMRHDLLPTAIRHGAHGIALMRGW